MKINSQLGIFQRLGEGLKSVNHGILRKLGHVKPRNHLADLGKLFQGKTDGLVKKRIDLRQQPLSLKELMLI